MSLGRTSTIAGGATIISSVTATALDDNIEGALDATTLLEVGGTLTTLALTDTDGEIKEKEIKKAANVVDYLETYSENQRNDLINQIDNILEDKDNTLKLTKKM